MPPADPSRVVTTILSAFISYSHADRTAMDRVADHLESLGVEVWKDTKMIPAAIILEQVVEEISLADAYVVGLSPTSARSGWVQDELMMARTMENELGHPRVLPVLLEGGVVPRVLAHRLYVDMRSSAATDWRDDLRRFVKPDAPRRAKTPVELHRLPHGGDVRSVAFGPDSTRLFTASDDASGREWDLTTEHELQRFVHSRLGRAPKMLAIAVSPDGELVATCARDATALVWSHGKGPALRRITHRAWVRGAAFSPDGKELATGSDDATARVRRLATGVDRCSFEHPRSVNAVAFHPDARRLATACDDHVARLWDLTAPHQPPLLSLPHDDAVWDVAFSQDGDRLATASSDGFARVWDRDGAKLLELYHAGEVWAVAFDPAGARLATAGDSTSAQLWDLLDGSQLFGVNHDDIVWSVAFSPDGDRLATGSADGTARVWGV